MSISQELFAESTLSALSHHSSVQDTTPIVIVSNYHYWIDSSGIATIETILQNDTRTNSLHRRQNIIFTELLSKSLFLGFQQHPIWLRVVVSRIPIHPTYDIQQLLQEEKGLAFMQSWLEPYMLSLVSFPRSLDSVMFYAVRKNTLLHTDTAGYSVPLHQWHQRASAIHFPLQLALGDTSVYYLQVQFNGLALCTPRIWSERDVARYESDIKVILYIFYGIGLFAGLYNLILFVVTRSKFYFLYVTYIFLVTLHNSIATGHFYLLFPFDIPFLYGHIYIISALAYNLVNVVFVWVFLRDSRHIRLPNTIQWGFVAYILVCSSGILADIFGYREFTLFVVYYNQIFLGLPISLFASFILWWRGYKPALYLLISGAILQVGLTFHFAGVLNVLNLSNRFVNDAMFLAPALEMIFFGFALAARINVIQKEGQQAELKALQAELLQQQNEELAAANTHILQQQQTLHEQSERIQSVNSQLQDTNSTLQLQNQRLQELDHEKNELMGIVVHDLKNPIGSIRGFAELLQHGIASPEEIPLITTHVITTANRMLDLVANLLEVNRLESGGMQFQMAAVNIMPIVEGTVWQYQSQAAAKQISLHFENMAHSTIAIVDERAMIQILDNLISNAVKYSPFDKNIFIQLKSTPDVVRIEVTDEGPGISESDMKKLFGKFARLTAQPTGDEHSTGLGLSIVKKMVEAMNGRVWCESELGKGATFIVELPKYPLRE